MRALRALVERERPGAPFDVALGGSKRPDDWEAERRRIGALAEAGATWWIEYVEPADLATMRGAVGADRCAPTEDGAARRRYPPTGCTREG